MEAMATRKIETNMCNDRIGSSGRRDGDSCKIIIYICISLYKKCNKSEFCTVLNYIVIDINNILKCTYIFFPIFQFIIQTYNFHFNSMHMFKVKAVNPSAWKDFWVIDYKGSLVGSNSSMCAWHAWKYNLLTAF